MNRNQNNNNNNMKKKKKKKKEKRKRKTKHGYRSQHTEPLVIKGIEWVLFQLCRFIN
jgi:hypothetical protein